MHLFLSPHYDDAVYSCGGLIAQLTRAGETVRVYTVMGAQPPHNAPNTPLIRELHARWQAGDDPVKARRLEDETAVHLLDGEVGYNNALPDCIYRTAYGGRPLYPNATAIFGTVDPDDPAIVALELKLPNFHQLWQAIHFDENDNPVFVPLDRQQVTVYAPLGAGNHVDHQIVRDWAFKLLKLQPATSLMLYEDFPYIRDPKAILAPLKKSHFALESINTMLDEEAIQAKIKAIAAYRSQFDSFWTDEQAMIDDVRDTLMQRGKGRPSEVMYRVEG